ncbi:MULTISPECIES: N-acetylmuramoyl-L-alanine amidase [Acinetobacter]|jgi:N-acetylmuramoyl-L-alanine amidase|uniref:N-acetylmuramoyl-L-alanine amidase n=2 Tax=Acinetobacter radioresistens TaxID=40216 RepID=A0A8H2JZA8_ACIRA|nr:MULTISPECIES: N-acetylmuramoyl-L-alanine amidase [Acinetobacter]MCK4099973.1 N-acetylmuramoyl-L-alanine amidase [Acinetobacter radioresistens]MCU4499957.1 N-acetylmuramoyl-L-alanine amidase [Acinetobacter radioresistens]MCU4595921.1 N-acetylmuramoyl-L-alanine amidase [Acinetobacter radioresistens]PSD35487.1 N-acetylmuramoyl-L-alanine amidase [Acinetobacter radioresistens]PSD35788.1 N-acetylmuramoyl-L-alanine amidase [Acinetobacter radioresistens]
MKLINESVWKFDSVKYGAYMALFLSCLQLVIQEVYNANILPEPYQTIASLGLMFLAVLIGRKKAQPNLNQNQPLGFVTVTAGHSNVDPGAVSGKFKEAELVTNFRNAVAYYLKSSGISIKTDGVGTTNNPLASAIKLIKGSSVAVEFHLNAAGSSQANGIETIALPKDKKLAQDLSKAVAAALGSRLRGNEGWIDQSQSARGKLGFISNGGLIVELGFISNEDEISRFNARYWLAAKAVADVLIDYEKRN